MGPAAAPHLTAGSEIAGEGSEPALHARGGRLPDSPTLAADQLPTGAEEVPRLIEAFVPLAKDAPGG